MRLGQRVLLVCKDDFMPPIGSVGEIVSTLDEDGDYDVLFPDCLCQVPPGEYWCVPACWLVPINDAPETAWAWTDVPVATES